MVVDTAYVCCGWQIIIYLKAILIRHASRAMIIWDKVNPAQI